jgi:hypothetical protein
MVPTHNLTLEARRASQQSVERVEREKERTTHTY